MNVGIVIQGPIYETKALISTYNNFDKSKIIVSTWKGQDRKHISNLLKNGFSVLQTRKPSESKSGYNNCNYQTISTFKGIEYLGEKFSHILKIRTDLLPSDINNFIDILSYHQDKLNFFSWINRYNIEYMTDFYLFGEYQKMHKFWNVTQNNKEDLSMFPEQFLFYKYFNDKHPKYDKYFDSIKSNLIDLSNNNIKLVWTKPDRENIDQVSVYSGSTDTLKI